VQLGNPLWVMLHSGLGRRFKFFHISWRWFTIQSSLSKNTGWWVALLLFAT
jgi:hypothetical protein